MGSSAGLFARRVEQGLDECRWRSSPRRPKKRIGPGGLAGGNECAAPNWRAIDNYLIRELYFKPWELDRLTLSELCVCLEDGSSPKPPGRAVPMGLNEIDDYVRGYKGLTIHDKLDLARKGKL